MVVVQQCGIPGAFISSGFVMFFIHVHGPIVFTAKIEVWLFSTSSVKSFAIKTQTHVWLGTLTHDVTNEWGEPAVSYRLTEWN
jgi:hypothetical protein